MGRRNPGRVVENVAQRIVVGDGSVTFEIRYLPFPSEIVATGERNGSDRNARDNSNPAHDLIDQVLTVFQIQGVDRMFSSDLGNLGITHAATALRFMSSIFAWSSVLNTLGSITPPRSALTLKPVPTGTTS